MRVAVLGHHPELFAGFNSLMTANIAYGFAAKGADVTILLPNTNEHPQLDRMAHLGKNVSTLDRFGGDIEIRVIEQDEELGNFDLSIWQSYFAHDEKFFPSLRKSSELIAKNFPRLLTGDRERDITTLRNSATRFDRVGCALKIDKSIADSLADEIPDHVSRTIYMPRGFREDWFREPTLDGPPVFGIEKGVRTDNSEYHFLIPVIEKLRQEYGRIDVIGARLNDDKLTTSSVGLLPAKDFYKKFLNPLWAYLMIDVDRSYHSVNAVTVDGKTVYPGLYENQIVEAQMAGAAVVGQEQAFPQELAASSEVGLRFERYNDVDNIVSFLRSVIENREQISANAQNWARANHSVARMIDPLIKSIQNL